MCMCVEVNAKSTESNEGNNKHEINDFTIVVLMDIEENLKKNNYLSVVNAILKTITLSMTIPNKQHDFIAQPGYSL